MFEVPFKYPVNEAVAVLLQCWQQGSQSQSQTVFGILSRILLNNLLTIQAFSTYNTILQYTILQYNTILQYTNLTIQAIHTFSTTQSSLQGGSSNTSSSLGSLQRMLSVNSSLTLLINSPRLMSSLQTSLYKMRQLIKVESCCKTHA